METFTHIATLVVPWVFLGLCAACFVSGALLRYSVNRIGKTSWESTPKFLRFAFNTANWVREYIANQDPIALPGSEAGSLHDFSSPASF